MKIALHYFPAVKSSSTRYVQWHVVRVIHLVSTQSILCGNAARGQLKSMLSGGRPVGIPNEVDERTLESMTPTILHSKSPKSSLSFRDGRDGPSLCPLLKRSLMLTLKFPLLPLEHPDIPCHVTERSERLSSRGMVLPTVSKRPICLMPNAMPNDTVLILLLQFRRLL